MSVSLTIKNPKQAGGTEFSISADLASTIAELKQQIASQAGFPKENIRLVCAGKIWQDVATVGSYEPKDGAIVHCLNNPPRAVPTTSQQTLSEVDPMQQLLGGGAPMQPAATGGDPMQQMMAQSQQMLMQNPEMMSQLMNSPMVQQMMSDPQMMRSMMSMNPQMQQLMEQRPEVARMLEDPEVIQQSLQMMCNPSLMREMQRNQDRAIGRLDVMPGGHNALVRAHEDVVDPLMAALSGGADGSGPSVDLEAYSQQAQGTPNNEALPNPWGAPAAAPTPVAANATPAQTPSALAAPAAPAPFAGGFPAFGAQPQSPAGQTNPMAAMMQQMMSNPAMMQQSMQMASQMFGAQQGAQGYGAPAIPAVETPALPPAQPQPNADPFAQMMQTMMSNPAMMQQSMQMAQAMNGNQGGAGGHGGFPGMFGMPPVAPVAPTANPAAGAPVAGAAVPDAFARAQFASQLAQLSAMGFCNEAASLRALQQHQGRVDAAIDALLAEGSS
jgi:ubiquilin